MNLFMRSIGFKAYGSEQEDTLIRRAITAGIKSKKIFRNDRHGKAIIVYGVSKSAGLAVFGHMVGEKFVYDTHYPYLFSDRRVKEKEIVVYKNLTEENFCGIVDNESRSIPHIFFVSNPIDTLFEIDHQFSDNETGYETEGDGALKQIIIKDVTVSYTGFAIAASVLLPAYDKNKFFHGSAVEAQDLLKTQAVIRAGKAAVAEKEKEAEPVEAPVMSTIKRAETEDILSIVDTHMYPGGQVGEGYVVLGNIIGLRVEENVISKQSFYIMTLQMNDDKIDVAVNTSDVIGEPRVGRRFNARMWLHGYIG